jgi:hypothetical protein
MTQSIPCPYCGDMMTPPIKFCVGCGRSVNPDDVKNTGLKVGKSKGNNGGRFALAKKEYSMHRKMRSMMWTTAAVMALVLGYYCTMKFGLNEEPWLKWEAMAVRFINGKPMVDPLPPMSNDATAMGSTSDPSAVAATIPPTAKHVAKPAAKAHHRAARKS